MDIYSPKRRKAMRRGLRLTQLYSVTALCTPRSLSARAAVAAADARAASVLAECRHVSTFAKPVFGADTTAVLSATTSTAADAAVVAEANDTAAAHQRRRGCVTERAEPTPAPASTQQGESLAPLRRDLAATPARAAHARARRSGHRVLMSNGESEDPTDPHTRLLKSVLCRLPPGVEVSCEA